MYQLTEPIIGTPERSPHRPHPITNPPISRSVCSHLTDWPQSIPIGRPSFLSGRAADRHTYLTYLLTYIHLSIHLHAAACSLARSLALTLPVLSPAYLKGGKGGGKEKEIHRTTWRTGGRAGAAMDVVFETRMASRSCGAKVQGARRGRSGGSSVEWIWFEHALGGGGGLGGEGEEGGRER